MKKKHLYTYIILAAIGIAGVFIGRYAGGFFTGFSVSSILFIIVGRSVVNRAAGRIDKQIKDIIVKTQFKEDDN